MTLLTPGANEPFTIRHYHVLLGLLLVIVVLACLAGLAVPAGLGWDFANFYDAGRMIAAGEAEHLLSNHKGLIGGVPAQGVLDFWGTPLSAWLYVPFAGFAPGTALVLFKLQYVLTTAAALLLLYRYAAGPLARDAQAHARFTLLFVAAVLAWQPFWTVFRVGGQTTGVVLLLLVAGLVLHSRLRFGASALLLVCTVMIKPALVTALLFLMLVSGRRFALWTLLHLALTGVLSLALMGWDIQLQFMHKMLGGSALISRWTYNSSLFSLVGEMQGRLAEQGDAAAVAGLVRLSGMLLKLGVVALFAWLVWSTRRSFSSRAARACWQYLLAILFFLLVSQTVWEHYLALLFIPLAMLMARRDLLAGIPRWMPVLLLLSLPLQNLIVVRLLQATFTFATFTALLPVLLLKTAPLWLTLWLLLTRHRHLAGLCEPAGPQPIAGERQP